MHRYMYIYTDLYTHAYKCTHIYAYIHMTRGNFNHFSCARTCGLNFIQPFLQRPKCGEVIVKTWNLRFSITSFQDIELWRGGNKIYCDLHDLPVCYQRKNQNASFALCLPNVANLSNIAESLLAVVMSPPPLAACYLQPNRLLHGRAPGKQDRESPVSPKAATAALQQDLHQTWPNKQFPWLVSDQPWADTEALFFSVTALPSSKKKQPCSFTTISTFSWWTWLIRAHGFKSSQREGWRYKQSMIT